MSLLLNKEFMIWATVSSQSCFCWLYRASPSLAAKNIINLIPLEFPEVGVISLEMPQRKWASSRLEGRTSWIFSSCGRCSWLTTWTSGTRSGGLRKGQSPYELFGHFLHLRPWINYLEFLQPPLLEFKTPTFLATCPVLPFPSSLSWHQICYSSMEILYLLFHHQSILVPTPSLLLG